MVSITALLSESADRLDRTLPLAVVPLVVSALSVGNFERIAWFDGAHVGVRFPVPAPVSSVWSFVSLPGEGLVTPLSAATPPRLAGFLLASLATAALGAGYLGSLRRAVAGDGRAFLEDAASYLPGILGFEVLALVVALAMFAAGSVAPPLFLLLLPAVVVLAYLFYATPYLVVTGDRALAAALAESYGHATAGGDYLGFFGRYLLAGAAASVPATVLAVNLGVGGAVLTAVLFAPVGVVFDTATMTFVRRLDGAAETPPFPAVRRVE